MAKIILSAASTVRSFESLVSLHKAPRLAKARHLIELDANGFPVESAASAIFGMVSAGPTMESDFLTAAGFTERAQAAFDETAAAAETLLTALEGEGVSVDDDLSAWRDGLDAEVVERVEKRVNCLANDARQAVMTEGHKAFRSGITAIRKAAAKDESKRLAVARGGFEATVFIRAADLGKVPADFRKLFVIDGTPKA